MPLIQFLWRRVTALASTVLLLLVLLCLFVAWRVFSAGQVDNAEHLQAKRDYLAAIAQQGSPVDDPPNIVFILYDDLGYGDLGHGARDSDMIATPHIDALAAGGVTLRDFHSPAAVCTPSRAGFLTGRLAPRAGLPNVVFPSGSTKAFLFSTLGNPGGHVRLPAEEITLADVLRAAGYTTGMVGKWHLGDRSPSLPNDMGFDRYFGALYSNDMEPFALYADREIAVPAPVDQRYLTERYTRAATEFIQASADGPFFLYFAHNFPHDPLYVRESRSGRSRAGLFGDVIEEIDDSVGSIVAALQAAGALDNTLIIITSDNGPWFLGNAGDQRGRKGNTFEGGMRVPFIAHWPAAIPGGRSEGAMAMGTDLLPTVLDLLQLPAPPDRELDGRSIRGVLSQGGPSPHDYLYYYDGETLFAARDQRFKYRGPAGVFYSTDQMPLGGAIPQKEWLFDLAGDPRESYDTSDRHPDHLARLRAAFEAKRAAMADNPRGWK
ncbi:MAG: arylsulfatase [Halioglobus sp.]|mgnify:CR=1 FL=1|nr:arylsulfatase [Halioglobus sp.]